MCHLNSAYLDNFCNAHTTLYSFCKRKRHLYVDFVFYSYQVKKENNVILIIKEKMKNHDLMIKSFWEKLLIDLNINSAIWDGSFDTHHVYVCWKYAKCKMSKYAPKLHFSPFLDILWHMAHSIFFTNIPIMGMKKPTTIAELIFRTIKTFSLSAFLRNF